jgi:hypothetical protein
MAKAKKAAKTSKPAKAKAKAKASTKVDTRSQAERLMEVARKARLDPGGSKFSDAMARITMSRNARKKTRMG